MSLYRHVLDVVEYADDLLDSPSKWTKGTLARDARLTEAYVDDENAVCWCLEGALQKANVDLGNRGYWLKAMDILRENVANYSSLAYYNDDPNTTFEDIKKLLARTIKKLKVKVAESTSLCYNPNSELSTFPPFLQGPTGG